MSTRPSSARASSAAAAIALACGLALAGTALSAGVVFFGTATWLTRGPLVVGALLALAGAVLGGARWPRRRARLALEIAVAAVIVIALNVAAVTAPMVVDVTRSKRNTLAEASVAVAKAVPGAVVVETTLAPDERAFAELSDLVGRYARENPRITLARPARDTSDVTRAMSDEKVVVTAGARRKKVRFLAGAPDQEEQLTNALRAVSTDARVRVYFLAGHGEAALDDDGAAGARRLGQALVDEGLEVVPLPLSLVGRVPDDAGAIVIAGANTIDSNDSALLQKYLDGGGRLLALLEPNAEPLASLLGSIGVQANADVVIDRSSFSGLLGGPETATGVAYGSHPVTAKVGAAMTHFPRARSLSLNPGTPAEATVLVQTGSEAYGETHSVPGTPPVQGDDDIAGPATLAIAATSGKARVVVVGDATFAENQGIGLGANRDLAVNAVLWLVEREGAIAVRPRGRGGNLLLLTPTNRERIAFALLYGLPVALLCAGLSITAVRRRR